MTDTPPSSPPSSPSYINFPHSGYPYLVERTIARTEGENKLHNKPKCLAGSRDGRFIYSTDDDRIVKKNTVGPPSPKKVTVYPIPYDSDSDNDGYWELYNEGNERSIVAMALAPNDEFIVTCEGAEEGKYYDVVKVFDSGTLELLYSLVAKDGTDLPRHNEAYGIICVDISPDSTMIV